MRSEIGWYECADVSKWACKDYGTGATCADEDATKEFMETAINWFKGHGSSMVVRWAWFGAFPGLSDTVNGISTSSGSVSRLSVQKG